LSKTTETAQEKVRVYILAKELKLETKDLLAICQELGFAGIKNQLSGLEADQVGALKKRVKDGPKQAAPTRPTAPVPAAGGPPKSLDSRVRTLPPAKPKAPAPVAPPPPPVEPEPVAPAAVVEPPVPVAVAPPPAEPDAVAVTAPEPVAEVVEPVAAPEPEPVVVPAAVAPPVPSEPEPPPLPTSPPPASVMPATGVPGMRGMPNLNPNRPRPITGAGGRAPTHGPSQPRPTQATPTPPAASANPTPSPAAPTPPAAPPAAPSANPNPPRMAPPPSSGTGPVRPLPSTGSPPPAGARPPLPSGNPQAPVRSRTPTFGPDGRIPQGQGQGPNRVAPPPAGGKAPPPVASKTNSIKLTPEQIKKMREMEQRRGGKISIQDIAKQVTQTAPPADGAPPAADKATDRRSPLPRPGANTGGKPTAAEEEEAKK